jgi:hypothetical protein
VPAVVCRRSVGCIGCISHRESVPSSADLHRGELAHRPLTIPRFLVEQEMYGALRYAQSARNCRSGHASRGKLPRRAIRCLFLTLRTCKAHVGQLRRRPTLLISHELWISTQMYSWVARTRAGNTQCAWPRTSSSKSWKTKSVLNIC